MSKLFSPLSQQNFHQGWQALRELFTSCPWLRGLFFRHLEVSYMLQHEKGVDCLCLPQVVSQISLELQLFWYKSICSSLHCGHMRVLFCNNAHFDTQQRNKLMVFPCKELVAVCWSYAPPPATSITWKRRRRGGSLSNSALVVDVVTFKRLLTWGFLNLLSLHHAVCFATVLWSYALDNVVFEWCSVLALIRVGSVVIKLPRMMKSSTCAWGNVSA